MSKHVKFTASLTSGSIQLFEIFIQGTSVSTSSPVSDERDTSAAIYKVKFIISALNGTDYTITYKCSSDGVGKTDAAKPTPISGRVINYNTKVEELSIIL